MWHVDGARFPAAPFTTSAAAQRPFKAPVGDHIQVEESRRGPCTKLANQGDWQQRQLEAKDWSKREACTTAPPLGEMTCVALGHMRLGVLEAWRLGAWKVALQVEAICLMKASLAVQKAGTQIVALLVVALPV